MSLGNGYAEYFPGGRGPLFFDAQAHARVVSGGDYNPNLHIGGRQMARLLAVVALVSLLVWVPRQSWAGSSAGTISQVAGWPSGVILFVTTGSHSTKPSCATQDRWALNASTPGGQALLATIMTAYAEGKTVNIIGTGTCDLIGDTESIAFIYYS